MGRINNSVNYGCKSTKNKIAGFRKHDERKKTNNKNIIKRFTIQNENIGDISLSELEGRISGQILEYQSTDRVRVSHGKSYTCKNKMQSNAVVMASIVADFKFYFESYKNNEETGRDHVIDEFGDWDSFYMALDEGKTKTIEMARGGVNERGMDSDKMAVTLHMDEKGSPHMHIKFSTYNPSIKRFQRMDTIRIVELNDLRSKNEKLIKSLDNVEFTDEKGNVSKNRVKFLNQWAVNNLVKDVKEAKMQLSKLTSGESLKAVDQNDISLRVRGDVLNALSVQFKNNEVFLPYPILTGEESLSEYNNDVETEKQTVDEVIEDDEENSGQGM